MNATLLLSSQDPEVLWNAFRLANLMLNQGDEVTIFLNGPAVGYRALDSEAFPLALLAKTFVLSEGTLLAWGKSLGIHGVDSEKDEHLKQSGQMELYRLIRESDRVIYF